MMNDVSLEGTKDASRDLPTATMDGLSPILELQPSAVPQPQPIPTSRRAPAIPQLESPSTLTPIPPNKQQLVQAPAASPPSVAASRDDQFQFLVSTSDFSPGPLVSPIGQRLLSDGTASTNQPPVQRARSGSVLAPASRPGTDRASDKPTANGTAARFTSSSSSHLASERAWILTPTAGNNGHAAPWTAQGPGPIARSSLPQAPAPAATAASPSVFMINDPQIPSFARPSDVSYPQTLQTFTSISLNQQSSFNQEVSVDTVNNSIQRASNQPTTPTSQISEQQHQLTQPPVPLSPVPSGLPFPSNNHWPTDAPLLHHAHTSPLPLEGGGTGGGGYLPGVGWPLDGAGPPPSAHQAIPTYLSRAMGSWGNQGNLSYDPDMLLLSVQAEDTAAGGQGTGHTRHRRAESSSGSGWGGGSHYPSHHAVGPNYHNNHVIQSASMANSRASSLHQLPVLMESVGNRQSHSGHDAPPPNTQPHDPYHHQRVQHPYADQQPPLHGAVNPLELPLLGPVPGHTREAAGGRGAGVFHNRLRNSGRKRDTSWLHELWQLLKLALPCVVITGSTQVLIVASQIIAGHLGTTALAATAIGNMLWLVGYYAVIGTCTALETLGAQAVGADDYGRLVVWDLAAAFTCTLLAIPLAGALWNADALAQSLLGQDEATSSVVVEYCRGLVPGLWPAVWAIILSKHMQAQSQVLLPALAAGSSAIVYVLVAMPLVQIEGIVAVSIAASIARAYQLVAMLFTVIAFESYKGARWWSTRLWLRSMARWQTARRGRMLTKFLSLGAPGCLAAALESAGWEVTTAMAAYLGTVQVAVHASALSVATLVLMCVPMALAIAANIRVSQLLGSGQGQSAHMCARVVVTTGTVATCFLGVVLYMFRHVLGWAFTSHDTAIVTLLCDIAPLVAVYQGVAGLLGSTQGVLRGLGRQGTLVVHNSLGLCAGTLLGAWLTWGPRTMGLPGLWAGSIVGTTITALLNGLTLLLVEWSHEVHQARNMQSMQQGVRARQQMIYRALHADEVPDDALVEALLAEAQQDPRPLHVIYQEYAWFRGGSSMATTSMALSRAQSEAGAAKVPTPPCNSSSGQQQQAQQAHASGRTDAGSASVVIADGQAAT